MKISMFVVILFSLNACRNSASQNTTKDVIVNASTSNEHDKNPSYILYFPLEVMTKDSSESYICQTTCKSDYTKAKTKEQRRQMCSGSGRSLKRSFIENYFEEPDQKIVTKNFLKAISSNESFSPKAGSQQYDTLISIIKALKPVFYKQGIPQIGCGRIDFDSLFGQVTEPNNSQKATGAVEITPIAPNTEEIDWEQLQLRGEYGQRHDKGKLYYHKTNRTFHFFHKGKLLLAKVSDSSRFKPRKITVVPWNRSLAKFANSCFPAGTLIESPNGPIAIETLSVGDQVYSVDQNGELQLAHVVDLLQHQAFEIGEFELEDGSFFYPTPAHPVFKVESKSWVNATSLNLGDSVLFFDQGQFVAKKIIGRSFRQSEETVYNFTVKPNHNYIADKVLVHNY